MSECTDPDLGVLLHAYELNALSDQESDRFEIHVMKCAYCFNQAKQFQPVAKLMRESDTIKEIIAGSLEEDRESDSLAKRFWHYLWPDAPIVFRPALAYLLLVLMAVPLYRMMTTGPNVSSQSQIQQVKTLHLVNDRSTEIAVLRLQPGREGLLSFHCFGTVPGRSYTVVLEDDQGNEVGRWDNFDTFDRYEVGRLALPAGSIGPGEYRLVITDPDSAISEPIQMYRFQIME